MKYFIVFVCTDSTEIFFSKLRSAGLSIAPRPGNIMFSLNLLKAVNDLNKGYVKLKISNDILQWRQ